MGWIAAPATIASRFEIAKQAMDLCTGGFDQRVVFEAWRRGVFDREVPRLRARYQEKRTVMTRALQAELGDLVHWPAPRGGFFLWATLPGAIRADAMLSRAVRHRVIYVAGGAFFVDGSGANIMRLSFSAPGVDRIVEGVARLGAVVREELAACTPALKGPRS